MPNTSLGEGKPGVSLYRWISRFLQGPSQVLFIDKFGRIPEKIGKIPKGQIEADESKSGNAPPCLNPTPLPALESQIATSPIRRFDSQVFPSFRSTGDPLSMKVYIGSHDLSSQQLLLLLVCKSVALSETSVLSTKVFVRYQLRCKWGS